MRHWKACHRNPASLLEAGVPRDVAVADDELRDEAYYLLMIVHQALVVGPNLERQTGLPLPKPKIRIVVEKLRNVHEHWDRWQPLTKTEAASSTTCVVAGARTRRAASTLLSTTQGRFQARTAATSSTST